MAISHPCTGMTFRVLNDHRGAPISALQSTSKEVRQPRGMVGRGLECYGQTSHIPHFSQYGDLGVEGVELWLAASGDQRVSIWASDWPRDRCELLEWLSFPAPAVSEVRVHGHMGEDRSLHNSTQPTAFHRLRASCPPLLLPSALGIRQYWCVWALVHMKR